MKRLYFDMDNVLADFPSGLAKIDPEIQKQYEGQADGIPGIFALMEPVAGAVEAVKLLEQHFDVYILSTAPWKNPSAWSDKLEWVKKYFGDIFEKRLILTHHKDFCKGDYLIDDREGHGAKDFEGEWIHFRSERFPDWPSVTDYLLLAENLLQKAEELARQAHQGQKDKAGDDYITHPLRVSERCKTLKAKIVALLHDTIEDTYVTPDLLRQQGFDKEIIDGVLSVTRKDGETYAQFIERAAANAIGKEVKIADLEDNMDVRRLPDLGEKELHRLRKYLHAWRFLQGLEPDTKLIEE